MTLIHTSFILLFLCFCSAESADPIGNFCNTTTSKSGSSQISANIDHVLAEVVSITANAITGYIATSYGIGQDQVYGLAQCRGDVGSKDCSSCVQDAAKQIRQRCPNQTDVRIWYDYCLLRYSNENFIGIVDTDFEIHFKNVENVKDRESLNKQLGALMDKIRSQAVVPGNELRLGKGKTTLSSFLTLYALVQCTRDLSQMECAYCLAIAVGKFPNFCQSSKGCRVMSCSCYLRYELYPFFFPLDSNDATPNTTVMAIVYP